MNWLCFHKNFGRRGFKLLQKSWYCTRNWVGTDSAFTAGINSHQNGTHCSMMRSNNVFFQKWVILFTPFSWQYPFFGGFLFIHIFLHHSEFLETLNSHTLSAARQSQQEVDSRWLLILWLDSSLWVHPCFYSTALFRFRFINQRWCWNFCGGTIHPGSTSAHQGRHDIDIWPLPSRVCCSGPVCVDFTCWNMSRSVFIILAVFLSVIRDEVGLKSASRSE